MVFLKNKFVISSYDHDDMWFRHTQPTRDTPAQHNNHRRQPSHSFSFASRRGGLYSLPRCADLSMLTHKTQHAIVEGAASTEVHDIIVPHVGLTQACWYSLVWINDRKKRQEQCNCALHTISFRRSPSPKYQPFEHDCTSSRGWLLLAQYLADLSQTSALCS